MSHWEVVWIVVSIYGATIWIGYVIASAAEDIIRALKDAKEEIQADLDKQR